jgi:uncharacterized paraquat-inducible protein A
MKKCANELCGIMFTAKRHNQKYCSNDCCKIVTNSRIMDAYYEDKARRQGKTRICNTCKTNKLSRYNKGKTCQMCESVKKTEQRNRLLIMVSAA